jgi:hypothetical protein
MRPAFVKANSAIAHLAVIATIVDQNPRRLPNEESNVGKIDPVLFKS